MVYHVDNKTAPRVKPHKEPVFDEAVRWFTDQLGDTPTVPQADWFNMVQAELLGLAEALGVTPDKLDDNQLGIALTKAFEKVGADIGNLPKVLDNLGDSRKDAASQRIVNLVNKLAKDAMTAAMAANENANRRVHKDSVLTERDNSKTKVVSGYLLEESDYHLKSLIKKRTSNSSKLYLIAHRGFRNQAMQNTIIAMSTALRNGACAVECDVQPSLDGTLYLFHDDTVDSLTTGSGRFNALSDLQIELLRFKSLQNTHLEDLRIPNIDEFLKLMQREKCEFYLEIKNINTDQDIEKVIATIVEYDLVEECVIQSFDLRILEVVRSLNKEIRIGALGANADASVYLNAINKMKALKNGMLLWNHKTLLATPVIVKRALEAGIDIGTYTVNSLTVAESLLAIGVNKVMSDISLK